MPTLPERDLAAVSVAISKQAQLARPRLCLAFFDRATHISGEYLLTDLLARVFEYQLPLEAAHSPKRETRIE